MTENNQLLTIFAMHDAAHYPTFQFTVDGAVRPEIAKIVQIFNETPEPETPLLIVSWLNSPKVYLDGQTPLEWLDQGREAAPVIMGAEQSAACLAH